MSREFDRVSVAVMSDEEGSSPGMGKYCELWVNESIGMPNQLSLGLIGPKGIVLKITYVDGAESKQAKETKTYTPTESYNSCTNFHRHQNQACVHSPQHLQRQEAPDACYAWICALCSFL